MVQRSMEDFEEEGASCLRDTSNFISSLFARDSPSICECNGKPAQGGDKRATMEDGYGKTSARVCEVQEETGQTNWYHEGGRIIKKGEAIYEGSPAARVGDTLKVWRCQTHAIEGSEEDTGLRSCVGVSSPATTQIRSAGKETFSKGLCVSQSDASGPKKVTEAGK